jgi:hypothetical protein
VIRKKGTKNHIRKSLTRSRRQMMLELDAVARMEVFERDGFACIAIKKDGTRCNNPNPQWAHVKSRRNYALRWHPANAMSLCSAHHRWWHSEPTHSGPWFRETFPDRQAEIDEILQSKKKVRVEERWQQLQEEAAQ